MKNCRIGIIGVGQRGCAYIELAKTTPGVELAALCDINRERMQDFATRLDCADVPLFTNVDDMLESDLIDAAVITVPDFQHAAVAEPLMRHDKHIILEKPMAPSIEECRRIIDAYRASNVVMQLGFVLREHPIYKKIKEIVESGRLGHIMSVQSTESLGVMHGASYMRRWHRKIRNSGGFMLAKCSHDLDLLNWIIDSVPVRVASFGGINFFKPDRQSATYCSQCQDESCRFRFKGEMVVMSDREKKSPSDRKFDLCVYNDDKDIVDTQVSILEYANGVNAAFALNLFAPRGKRTMAIVGTEGYLDADTENCLIKITSSIGLPDEEICCKPMNGSGHGGSDSLFFEDFIKNINNGWKPKADWQAGMITTIVGNALEKARLTGDNVKILQSEYK